MTFKEVATISLLSAALATAYAWVRPGLRGALVAAAYLAFAFYSLPIHATGRFRAGTPRPRFAD